MKIIGSHIINPIKAIKSMLDFLKGRTTALSEHIGLNLEDDSDSVIASILFAFLFVELMLGVVSLAIIFLMLLP